jgi:hypothetical protein
VTIKNNFSLPHFLSAIHFRFQSILHCIALPFGEKHSSSLHCPLDFNLLSSHLAFIPTKASSLSISFHPSTQFPRLKSTKTARVSLSIGKRKEAKGTSSNLHCFLLFAYSYCQFMQRKEGRNSQIVVVCGEEGQQNKRRQQQEQNIN